MNNRNNGSRIFMTELMFSILFFIIVTSVCVQCFARSYSKSKEATELTHAVNIATNISEEYLATPDYQDLTQYYDANWQKTDDEKGSYKVTATIKELDESSNCQTMRVIVATVEEKELYSLKVEKALK